MAPVALGIEVAEEKAFLHAVLDRRHGAGDLSSHECFAAHRAFMIEKNAVTRMHTVGFTVVHRDPIGIKLRGSIWRTRIKWCRLGLRHLACFTEKLGSGGLVETRLLLQI